MYVFPHLTFEEYLAARHLGEAGIEEQACELLRQNFDRWSEVFMLLGEHLCFAQPAQGRMEGLFQILAPQPWPAQPDDTDWRAVWLAGELLALYRRVFPKPSHSETHIRDSLRRLVHSGALDLGERAAAADTLDALGWLPPDLYNFIAIPPSPLSPAPSPFYLAQYPVTNAQYERFLNAPDFGERAHWVDFPKFDENSQAMSGTWGDEGWKWLQERLDEQGKVYTRYWTDPSFGSVRRGVPVVRITWYEANAYCKWLLAHWDELEEGRANPGLRPALVRLPTEAEWVAAAGGAQTERRFPWDKPGQVTQDREEILCRANVGESDINRTTPVGMYPLGVSQPYGLWDMAGNVWEWQASYSSGSRQYLALRGGAWGSGMGSARLSLRLSTPPDHGWSSCGFRVLASPSLG